MCDYCSIYCCFYIFTRTINTTEEKEYSIVCLSKGDIKKSVETTGEVVPKLEVEIKCKASGEIVKMR